MLKNITYEIRKKLTIIILCKLFCGQNGLSTETNKKTRRKKYLLALTSLYYATAKKSLNALF